jgi:ABC-type transporter Mla subunit MlaD
VRDKARILDPDDLAAGLKTAAFEPAMQALGAIDPAALKERLQASFEKALQAITGTLRAILDDVGTALNEQLTELKAAVATLAGDIKETIASAVQSFGDLAQNLENLVVVDVLGRLRQIIETLAVSFDQELDRVVSAFDAMLQAIPLNGGGGGITASVSA